MRSGGDPEPPASHRPARLYGTQATGGCNHSLSFSDSLLRALRSTCACLSLEQVLAAGTVSAGARGGKVSTLDVSRALTVSGPLHL